ncbi:hypothetical protein Bca4012_038138 [Brassica carinata]
MSGQSGNVGSKRRREVFLTSSSLSFSSLSSSCTSSSSEDAIEISHKVSRASYEDQIRGKLAKAYYSPGSGMLCVRMEPAPSPRPVQLMNICLGTDYDPERIPASVFAKTGGDHLNWSKVSNDSLFSLRMSTCQAFRQSINIKLEESEFLSFSPSRLEDAQEEKRSQVKEQAKTVVMMTSVKTNIYRERSSTSTPRVSFDQLYQAPHTKSQAFPLPLGEKKNKKKKKTNKEQSMCRIWSWLCSGVSKDLSCCYKWRKSCCSSRRPKAMVL